MCNGENHYATNVGAVLGQIATGGGASHLEQITCTSDPSLSTKSYPHLECTLGILFEAVVSKQLLSAGKEERQLAILNGCYQNGVPAITVVVHRCKVVQKVTQAFIQCKVWCWSHIWCCNQKTAIYWS